MNPVTTPTTVTAAMAAAAETRRLDIEAMHAKALSIFTTIKANPNVTFAKKHAIDFYEHVVHTNPSNQQQMKGNCMCCSRCIPSTGSFKFAEHLMKCPLCPREVKNAFIGLNAQTEGKRAEKRDGERMATEEAQLAAQEHEHRTVLLKQQCIKAGIKQSEVNAADLAIGAARAPPRARVIHHRLVCRAVLCIIRIILYFYIKVLKYCYTPDSYPYFSLEPSRKHTST